MILLQLIFFVLPLLLILGLLYLVPYISCLLVLGLIVLMGAFLVFLGYHILWLLGLLALLFLASYWMKHRKWQSLPTYEEYLQQKFKPDLSGPTSYLCKFCGSKEVKNVGLYSNSSKHRIYLCMNCGRELFRATVHNYRA